jgi:hypothetical protein
MDRKTRDQLVARYKDGYRVVSTALVGATDAELDARPAPNKWNAREIVHHLADSEMTSAVRLRLLLAEEQPQIRPYDQDHFARTLHYDRPIANSMRAFEAARLSSAVLIDRLAESDWSRAGIHPEHGRFSVERWLEIYAEHAHKHADQITRARASLRK